MSERDNGGPAFPFVTEDGDGSFTQYKGMTLRDYFAAKALQGYLASFHPESEPVEYAGVIARDCYALADAMLAERAK